MTRRAGLSSPLSYLNIASGGVVFKSATLLLIGKAFQSILLKSTAGQIAFIKLGLATLLQWAVCAVGCLILLGGRILVLIFR